VAILSAAALKLFHVIVWVDKHPNWGDTSHHRAIISVQGAYHWAEELGYIGQSPICTPGKPLSAPRGGRYSGLTRHEVPGLSVIPPGSPPGVLAGSHSVKDAP
jgi:hypothetical protein